VPPDEQRNRRTADAAIEQLQTDMQLVKERLDSGARRMNAMQTELTANTAVTAEVRDILDAGRTGLRVRGGLGTAAAWLGKLAAAAVAIWGAFYAITHGGQPPGK